MDYVLFENVRDPRNLGQFMVFRLPYYYLHRFVKQRHSGKLEEARHIETALRNPRRAFEGLAPELTDTNEERLPDGLCFLIDSPHRYRPGVEMPSVVGDVFLVFTTKDGKILDWRTENVDGQGALDENDYVQHRFGRELELWT